MKNITADYIIAGEGYSINIQNNSLVNIQKPQVELSIYDMLYAPDGYYFNFDANEKRILIINKKEDAKLRMPHLCTMIPDKVASHYGLDSYDLHTKTDYEIMIDKQPVFDRQMGKLPTVEIAGNSYIVDFESRSLRSVLNDNIDEIKFSDLMSYYDLKLKTAVFPYNPETMKIQDFDSSTITEVPKDIVLVKLPHHLELDPVGAYRSSKTSIKDVLHFMPQKSVTKAQIIEWKDTKLPERIKENKEKLSLERVLENRPASKKIR